MKDNKNNVIKKKTPTAEIGKFRTVVLMAMRLNQTVRRITLFSFFFLFWFFFYLISSRGGI